MLGHGCLGFRKATECKIHVSGGEFMATLDQVRAFAQGGSARIQR